MSCLWVIRANCYSNRQLNGPERYVHIDFFFNVFNLYLCIQRGASLIWDHPLLSIDELTPWLSTTECEIGQAERLVDGKMEEIKMEVDRMGLGVIVSCVPQAVSELAFYLQLTTMIEDDNTEDDNTEDDDTEDDDTEDDDTEDEDTEDDDTEDDDTEDDGIEDGEQSTQIYRLIAYDRDGNKVATEIVSGRDMFVNLGDEFLITNEAISPLWRFHPISTKHQEVRIRLDARRLPTIYYTDGYLYGMWKTKKAYYAFRVPLVKPGLPMQWSHVCRHRLLVTDPRTRWTGMSKNTETGNIVATETVFGEIECEVSTVLFPDYGQRHLEDMSPVTDGSVPFTYTIRQRPKKRLKRPGLTDVIIKGWEEKPVYVNAKQLQRILKRRKA